MNSSRETETIDNFWCSRITDRHNILLVDDSVTIDIFIFDISGRIFAKLLFRRVCHIFIIYKQTFGYVTISLAQLRTDFTSPWSSRVNLLQQGFARALLSTVLTFLLVDLLQAFALLPRSGSAAILPMLHLFARETALSCLLLLPVYPALRAIRRIFPD